MLDSMLRIQNFAWAEESLAVVQDAEYLVAGKGLIPRWVGQFALAMKADAGRRIVLIRDRLGINKLFYAIHESGRITVGNYLIDLVEKGIPFECIFSVPAGHRLVVYPSTRSLSLARYYRPVLNNQGNGGGLDEWATEIRETLDMWFGKLASAFHSRQVWVCVSGGLDSGLIAALAKKYFRHLAFYTFSFQDSSGMVSEDAQYAERLAQYLNAPWRLVTATSWDIERCVEKALLYGQDWRDFNVHCAIVNELLAEAMEREARAGAFKPVPLVLTGDLMNELLADYSPVMYGQKEFYALPKLDPEALRFVLVKGLDSGDREIGVFGRHGLDVIQPYGLVAELYLALPTLFVREPDAKQRLARGVGGDLLPGWIFGRPKVRAQIGDSLLPRGILPVLVDAGLGSKWLRKRFNDLFRIRDMVVSHQFIRAGNYRFIKEYPQGEVTNGYVSTACR